MKKILIVVAAVLASSLLVVGCMKTPSLDKLVPGGIGGLIDQIEKADKADPVDKTDGLPSETVRGEESKNPGFSSGNSYEAYLEAKAGLIEKMTRAFDAFRDHGMEAVFSIIGFTTADIMMWPAAILWDDELSAQQTAAIFGAVDMKLERSGNKASLTYNLDGEAVSFTGEPTDGADGFVFSFIQGGHEKLRSEFVRTPYGFAGQYFLTDDDGKARHYMVTIAGEEGAIGIDQDAVRPGPLTGKESLDFPLTASEWYRIEGKQLTGLTGDGFNIEATIP